MALIQEIGRSSYLVSVIPLRKELAKGVRKAGGATVDTTHQSVILRLVERTNSDEGYEADSSSDDDEVGGGSASAGPEPPTANATTTSAARGGDHCPASKNGACPRVAFHLRPEVGIRSKEELFARMHLEPQGGFPRPLGMQRGCRIFNTKSRLARAWSSPPHVKGGQRIATFKQYGSDVCLGRVAEVYHSDLFTTALVTLDDAVKGETPGYERAYINVWTSKNNYGRHVGVPFYIFKHPLDDLDVRERLNIWRDKGTPKQRPMSTDGVGSTHAVGTDGPPRRGPPVAECSEEDKKDGWRVKLNRRAETQQRHKTLICPTEEEFARAQNVWQT